MELSPLKDVGKHKKMRSVREPVCLHIYDCVTFSQSIPLTATLIVLHEIQNGSNTVLLSGIFGKTF